MLLSNSIVWPNQLKFHQFFEIALGRSWDRLGNALGSISNGFLESKIDVNNDLHKNVNTEPPSKRKLKSQGLEGIERASTIDVKATSQACSQNDQNST